MAINYGRAAVGVGVGYVAYRIFRSAFSDANAAVDRLQAARCPGDDPKCRIVPAGDRIEQRAKYIAEMSWNSSLDPAIKKLAMQTLNERCDGQWCTPPRDHLAETKALAEAVYDKDSDLWDRVENNFAWVKKNVAYRKDHFAVDSYPSARRTAFDYHGEDCDGHCILINALNMVSGFATGMRIYQTKNSDTWDHIASLVEVPPHGGKFWVIDASVDKVREGGKVKSVYPTWQAPRQMLSAWIDFEILPGGGIKKVGSGP